MRGEILNGSARKRLVGRVGVDERGIGRVSRSFVSRSSSSQKTRFWKLFSIKSLYLRLARLTQKHTNPNEKLSSDPKNPEARMLTRPSSSSAAQHPPSPPLPPLLPLTMAPSDQGKLSHSTLTLSFFVLTPLDPFLIDNIDLYGPDDTDLCEHLLLLPFSFPHSFPLPSLTHPSTSLSLSRLPLS